MALGPITNLASAQFADEQRKREREQLLAADDLDQLKNQMAGLTEDEKTSPARLLELKNVHLDEATRRDAEQNAFLDQQAHQRVDRQRDALASRSRGLTAPLPTVAEREQTLSAPLGRFATEDPSMRAQELSTNPGGRIADLDALKDRLVGLQGGDDTPVYTDAPQVNAGRSETMPYQGALGALRGAAVPSAAIRREFGGTAPDTTLRFSDRPEPGMRRYNAPLEQTDMTPLYEDVGAPGGGYVAAQKNTDRTAQGALLASLDELRGEASRAKSTPQEVAQGIVTEQPEWDQKAADLGPDAVQFALTDYVAKGGDPKVAANLQKRYAGIADDVTDADGRIDLRDWADRLQQGRSPAPGEAATRAQTPSPIPKVEAEKQTAVQDALRAPENGPGSTRSPALAAEQASAGGPPPANPEAPQGPPAPQPGFFEGDAGLGGPPTQGEAAADFSTQGLKRGVGEAARFGLPLAGQAVGAIGAGILGKSPGAMNLGRTIGGALGGAGGTAIANYLEDQPITAKDELLSALAGGVSGPLLQGLGRGGAAAKGLGQGLAESVQGYRAAPSVARGFQAVQEARQLGQGVMGAGQQLAGNIAAEGVPGLAQTAIGERGRQLTPELIRMLSTRKGPKPTPAELDALLKMIGQ